jgi:hypothetical protein
MATYNTTGTVKPIDWDNITTPHQGILGDIITSNTHPHRLPGELLEYSFEYDMDFLKTSGLPEDEQNKIFKKELATKLVEKMIDEGHIVFTKQTLMEQWKIRFRAYTWVGNKDFIEQQRKNKR